MDTAKSVMRTPHNTKLILFTKSVHNEFPQSVHKECLQHAVVLIFCACAGSNQHHNEYLGFQSCNVEAMQSQFHQKVLKMFQLVLDWC